VSGNQSDVENMLRDIYDHINFRTPLENIMAHLQEEVGEIANCLNDFKDKEFQKDFSFDKNRQKLELEIADVVTWIYALLIKLDYLLASGKIYIIESEGNSEKEEKISKLKKERRFGITLQSILWKNFHAFPNENVLWCPSCKDRPCKLEIRRELIQ
jgi:NTP pyrophosphatase (non-canonical NTP hydrolase)